MNIKLSETAINKIKEISESEGMGHYNIRFKVIGGGCAGMTRDMYFEEIISPLDETMEVEGVTVIIDPLSLQYLDDTFVDYADNGISVGFTFKNDSIKTTCGCGNSFGTH